MPSSNNSVIIIAIGAASVAINGVEGRSRLAVHDSMTLALCLTSAATTRRCSPQCDRPKS